MNNISKQYQMLKENKINKHQFLRNARMLFPAFVTNHNSFEDSVKILKQKGLLTEKKEEVDLSNDINIKYKKVEKEPEVQEQNGIYPATSLTDIPKIKKFKKNTKVGDGLVPIKEKDTENGLKKYKEKTLNENIKRLIHKVISENKITKKKL
jgi:hypothetical protein